MGRLIWIAVGAIAAWYWLERYRLPKSLPSAKAMRMTGTLIHGDTTPGGCA